MTDLIIIAILAAIIIPAARYVYKSKKSGARCIGCSAGSGGCGCGCGGTETGSAEECCCHTEKN